MKESSEKHVIEVSGDEISAVHHKASSDKWIILCHGFGGNKDRGNKQRAEFFSENGWNAVRFDFRGNGESSGAFIDQNLESRIEDLKAVTDYFDPRKFVYFGTSFGGKVVFHTALERDPDGIIGNAPVTYNDIMGEFMSVVREKGRYEYIEGKPVDKRFAENFEKYGFSEVEKELHTPIFISHGADDQTVRFENSVKASKNISSDVHIQKLEGVKHSYTDEGKQKMNHAIKDWLKRLNL